jgi:hypothetical protein
MTTTTDLLAERVPNGQDSRLGPFTAEHLELLIEDFDAWESGDGRTFFLAREWWPELFPDLPLLIDFNALVEAGIPPEKMREHVQRDPLSVTFIARQTSLPYPASRFRWPSDTEESLKREHDSRVQSHRQNWQPKNNVAEWDVEIARLSDDSTILPWQESATEESFVLYPWRDEEPFPPDPGAWPLLPFPFFARVMQSDGDIPPSIGVNVLGNFRPTQRQTEWCCEILKTVERDGFLIFWWHQEKPTVGMSAGEHSQLARNRFRRLGKRPSERCQFPDDPGGEITNAKDDPLNPKYFDPLSMTEILDSLNKRFAGWPRRIDNSLFVLDNNGRTRFLPKPDALFSWYQLFGYLKWRSGSKLVTESQFFEALRASAKQYTAIESLPHEPPFLDRFYLTPAPEPGDGSALNALLERFSPETEHDRQLIAAMFATVIWGETGGQRPAFLLTADGGRGAGKTTLAKMVADLAGGHFSIDPSEDGERIKNRLLTPDSLPLRVALIDNIKSTKFSSGFLESLITANEISGHRLNCGNASRPNNLVWILTVNGASLATDMAQRVVTIKLDQPARSGNWEDVTARFIRENRQHILADLIGLLRRGKQPLARHSRWARWEDEVLSRLEQPDELQRLIMERQQVSDAEADENLLIEEYFERQLTDLGLETHSARLFIPFDVAYQWFCAGTGERNVTKNAMSRRLNQAIREARIKRLVTSKHGTHGRGYQWNGRYAMDDVDYASVAHAIEQRRIIGRGGL